MCKAVALISAFFKKHLSSKFARKGLKDAINITKYKKMLAKNGK